MRYIQLASENAKKAGSAAWTVLNNLVKGGGLFFSRVFQILVLAFRNFINARAQEAAASLAFYAIFSLFPLLIIVVSIMSFLIDESFLKNFILENIIIIFPISQNLLLPNLEQVLQFRSGIGIVGVLALVWISTNFFHIMTNNINIAWTHAPRRNFFRNRFIALIIVGLLALLVIPPMVATSTINVLSRLQNPFWTTITNGGQILYSSLSKVIPFIIRCLVFMGLYIWIPNTRVKKSPAFWGALTASVLWEIVTFGFVLYLKIGFVQYELIYGSLGAIFTLNLWIFLCCCIVLYGAHISSALSIGVEK